MQRIETPILIVGAGPVGLMGGILLSELGLASRVVERRPGPQRAPAAHVVNARTFEICRAAGVDMQAIHNACKKPEDAGFVQFLDYLAGESFGRLPFERQGDECLRFTPTPLRNLSQHRFEPILLERLRKASGSEIHYGHQWESAEADESGVTSRIRDLSTDTVYEVRSRYVLGADGAGSRVRKSLGIELEGPQRIQSFVMIHFGANLRHLVKDRPGVLHWICDPARGGTLVAHDIDREWVYMQPFDPDREAESDYDEARCTALVRRAIGDDGVGVEILHIGTWTMTAQVASRFRDGRIFLVGDSAHRFPPTGGLGLNSGVQDVHNLAWKIFAAEQDWAGPSLLDSFEIERRPIARDNADQSLRNALKLIEVGQALGTLEEPTTERMRATLADPEGRAGVEAAIANQAEHFDMLGLQLGFAYEEGAVAPDGTAKPECDNPVRDFVPTSRPGSRMPHAWVVRDGERVSTLDLLPVDRFALVTDPDGAAWEQAAASMQGVPILSIVIGRDADDAEGHWASVCELERGGALLVRPDQHVAWRARGPSPDPAGDLAQALGRMGLGSGAPS